MTREEAIARIREHKIIHKMNEPRAIYISEALEMAIKALEREPCGDCISRHAVDVLIDELARAISDERCCISRGRNTGEIMQDILDLPPVTPQQKVGRWIKSRDSYGNNHFTCPFCENDIATKYDGAWKDNYCSNCGAKMIGSEDADDQR